jgi:hypothetical protein
MIKSLKMSKAGIGAAIVLGALISSSPANCAPVLTSAAGLTAYAANSSIDVRWRGRGRWGAGALAAGIIAGLALGGLASSPYVTAYGPPYAYAPYTYGPGYYGFYGYSPGGRSQDAFRNGY